MQFHENFLIYLNSRVFLPGLFKFSGPLCLSKRFRLHKVNMPRIFFKQIFSLIFQGILENLEEQIVEHFVTNPSDCFLASNLSSYERLLAHVCSMYNQLSSQSFDDNGIRTLKIVNPRRKFHPIDPSLCEYLKTRKNKIF